ncbi:A24 family peptidase [Rahnella sp. AA]|uniref:prepilin peptidase n=1 Tax=Rahnella sp. AA TaxID=2057180 RepID=UPI0012FF2F73|nr:A24 family peptidase [Rahnella sp. AA]
MISVQEGILHSSILSDGQLPDVAHAMAAIIGLVAGVMLNTTITRFVLQYASDLPAVPKSTHSLAVIFCKSGAHEICLWLKRPLLCRTALRTMHFYFFSLFSSRTAFIIGGCASLFFGMSYLFDSPTSWLLVCLLSWFLVALSVIDSCTLILPDALTQPLLWFGLLLSTLGYGVPVESAILGAIAGYLSLWTLYWCLKLLVKKEGLGFGDFKLLAALGAWSGWEALPQLCTLAALTGIFYSVVLGRGSLHGNLIPFGPALSFSGVLIYISQRSEAVWLM